MPLSVASLKDVAKLFEVMAGNAKAKQDKAETEIQKAEARGEEAAYVKAANIIRQTKVEG